MWEFYISLPIYLKPFAITISGSLVAVFILWITGQLK